MAHFILPGSLEIDDGVVTAAVHTGANEFDVKGNGLRYVTANLSEAFSGETLTEFLVRIYEDSTGCLIKDTFARKTG